MHFTGRGQNRYTYGGGGVEEVYEEGRKGRGVGRENT